MNELTPVITNATVTILTALIALLGAYAVRWISSVTTKIRAQTEALADDQFRALVDEALGRVDDLATKTVTQLEQTTAKALRESAKTNLADKEKLKTLGRDAVQEILHSLNVDYLEAIDETVGDVERYVTNVVETKVYQLKNGITLLPSAITVE